MKLRTRVFLVAVSVLALACMPSNSLPSRIPSGHSGTLVLRGRDVVLRVPSGYDPGRPSGLVIGLHGYSSNAGELDDYFGLSEQAERRGLLLALPQGTMDARRAPFWNATSACCDFGPTGVDDSGFLAGVIELVSARYSVDPGRVWLFGHSNGGFMAHRLACDHAELVTGIVSLAGAQDAAESACVPQRSVAVLQIHGTEDETVAYSGAASLGGGDGYPSAVQTAARWARLDGCATTAVTAGRRHLTSAAGDDTDVTSWPGCRGHSGVELWTIQGGRHVPVLNAGFAASALDWLDAHAR